ncbi:MAG: hypothetical protein A2X67_04915 [Ignavibacteria bacterium GWA2_55_11]|nr:MAG: hypothetical protein A2X67_04915 [Ignavibacteria bacterium GWA2_55_11]OGU45917.1 MAG: hypothetical protein A2X68_00480 [Ignavibacteria bacterium GWC2_56_12]OGU66176.1 MAG: hypothetical protein A3C56_03485 [Ignavibacteria bacterium RIFCSPHIGHO2_02_FULL_56_12]OGU69559.1 MAG: hypothetical protein A3H45_07885 [Ignavibacteria bacterium RIFCSPLOWO2_02_FULL_55_14]OGU71793.1 MAG: hypothetical protein A3G43_07415 [Ignavibacteria bacterium RIFCSPLOWO2_12_FULL_56_21]
MRRLVTALLGLSICVFAAHAQELFFRVSLDSVDTGGTSPGRGSGFLILSSDRTTLQYNITVNNLQGTITFAHFHYTPTTGVVHTINFSGKTAVGSWAIPDTMVNHLFNNEMYVNVHTSANGGGEIRGYPEPHQHGFPIVLNGTKAGTASTGLGSGWVTFDDSSGSGNIRYRMTYAGLAGARTGAHFHALPQTTVVHTLAFTDSTADGTWVSPPDSSVAKLLRGQIYVNIHSTTFGSGDIRSELNLVGELPAVGNLTGAQASTAATGTGTVWAVLRPDLSIHYDVTIAKLTGPNSGSHFHTSRTGSVVHGVTLTNNHASGIWATPSDLDLADFVRNRLYFNVHTTANSSGEIRANMAHQDGAFLATLDGAQASTISGGKGTGWLVLNEDSVDYHVTYTGMTGARSSSHFHLSPGGGVIHPITFVDSTSSGRWDPGSNFIQVIRGNVYVNIHSGTFPLGEIRGNFKPGTGITTAVEAASQPVPESFALKQNFPNPFNPSTQIDFSLPRTARVVLQVYNLLGQPVATLVDRSLDAGDHRATYEARALPSGVYFYSLSADGKLVQTRRMLLLK